jgi:hypothetical protein
MDEIDAETKARIDAEERYRVQARARAEQNLNRPSQTPKAMSAPEPARASSPEAPSFLAGCGNTVSGCLIFVVIAAVGLVMIFSWISSTSSSSTPREYSEVDFLAYCEQAVTAQLKAPATAVFQPDEIRYNNIKGTGPEYSLVGTVDAQNGFGALIRLYYECARDGADTDVNASVVELK